MRSMVSEQFVKQLSCGSRNKSSIPASRLQSFTPASKLRAYRGPICLAERRGIELASVLPCRGTLRVIAIYPGTFDPPTNGHLDLIQRGAKIFDQLVVAILGNSEKAPLFTMDERIEITRSVFKTHQNVEVDTFEAYIRRCQVEGAQAVLRGIRAVSDYEYELQMAWMNRKLDPNLETVFMTPAGAYSYLSSRLVREIASLGGALSSMVPASVESRLRARLGVAGPPVSGHK